MPHLVIFFTLSVFIIGILLKLNEDGEQGCHSHLK